MKEILGIFRHENAPGRKIVAFVSYDDGTFEFVPTEVLAQIVHAAQVRFILIIIIKGRNTSQLKLTILIPLTNNVEIF